MTNVLGLRSSSCVETSFYRIARAPNLPAHRYRRSFPLYTAAACGKKRLQATLTVHCSRKTSFSSCFREKRTGIPGVAPFSLYTADVYTPGGRRQLARTGSMFYSPAMAMPSWASQSGAGSLKGRRKGLVVDSRAMVVGWPCPGTTSVSPGRTIRQSISECMRAS